jgi:hypothetical protein
MRIEIKDCRYLALIIKIILFYQHRYLPVILNWLRATGIQDLSFFLILSILLSFDLVPVPVVIVIGEHR